MNRLRIVALDLRDLASAIELRALRQAGYEQEAALLGLTRFAPLERTVEDLRAAEERFFGARCGAVLVGAIGVEGDGNARQLRIASLVVHPDHQRGGIGRRMLATVVARHGGSQLTVSTAAGNWRALHLYKSAGFIEWCRFLVEAGILELVELRRQPN